MRSSPPIVLGLPHLHWRAPNEASRRAIATEYGALILRALPNAEQLIAELQRPYQGAAEFGAVPVAGRMALQFGVRRPPADQSDAASGVRCESASRWSLACIEHPGGTRAIVVFDSLTGRLLIVRDPMGSVPLCYLRDDSGLIAVGLTAEQLATAYPSRVSLDRGRVADFLVDFLRKVDLQCTFYREIRRIPPGTWVCVSDSGLQEERYFRPEPRPIAGLRTPDDYSNALREQLGEAVGRMLRDSGVHAGAMLSGGMDSTSICAVGGRLRMSAGQRPLPTFSVIDGGEEGCIETAAIRSAANIRGIAPALLDLAVTGEDEAHFEGSLWDGDEPWEVHFGLLRLVYLSAQRLGLSAVFDGMDADSLFLEGDHVKDQIRRFKLLAAWRNIAGARHFWRYSRPSLPVEFMRACVGALRASITANAPWAGRLRRRIRGRRVPEGRPLEDLLREHPVHRRLAIEIDLPARVARYEEVGREYHTGLFDLRVPMLGIERYFSIASRYGVLPLHPFLDRQLFEFCLALPGDQRVENGWPKIVLRRAMRDLLPEGVLWRTGKEHLGYSFTRRLIARHPRALHLRLGDRRELLDGLVAPEVLDHLCASPASNDRDERVSVEIMALAEWLHRRQRLL